MLKIVGLSKSHKQNSGDKLEILNNISFEIPTSSTCSITGASGSGKSTLLSCIAGLEAPTSGQIFWNNTDICKLSEAALGKWRAQNVGIIFQSFHLLPQFSALMNVQIAAEIAGINNAKNEALNALELVGLSERVHHLPGQLSGGECQRVSAARAIVTKPKLLLCDEPTGNLDSDNAIKIMHLINDLQIKFNVTLILVTHDLNIAKQMSKNIHIQSGIIKNEPQVTLV